MSAGGAGVVSIASHLVGRDIKEMINSYFAGKSNKQAKYIKINASFKGLFITTNPIPLKAAMNMVGWDVGEPRLPLTPLPEHLVEKLKNIMRGYNLH